MKNTLKFLSLATTVSLFGTLTAETLGFSLPSALGVAPLFSLFVASLVSLIAFSDYTRIRKPRMVEAHVLPKSCHPLAA
ncbi:MAG: hypothetical protein HZC55_07605 [Verrucomicrobia bacterium]|nr:hypothetical protein [Verrucomicrobiota bacterium]